MIIERLQNILKTDSVIEKEGIFVAKEIAEKTVWDKLAIENPTHAVISAKDESEAYKKSEEQIADIFLLSAEETKSPGPLDETCSFSISPKSLIIDLDAFKHALVITFIFGDSNLID